MSLKTFFSRISDDFKQKELLPLKMLFFVQASTVLVLYPYLTIHMRELGINVEETAIMSAVTPVVAIIMPPLAGIIGDRIGNFKLMLAFLSSMGGLAALLLLAVPVGRYTVTFPDSVFLSVGCPGSSLELSWADLHPCQPTNPSPAALNLTLESCGVQCASDGAAGAAGAAGAPSRQHLNRTLHNAPRYTIRTVDPATRGADSFTYNMALAAPVSGARGGGGARGEKAQEGAGARVRLIALPLPLPAATAYFPTPGLHTLSCQTSPSSEQDPVPASTSSRVEPDLALRCMLGRSAPPGEGSPLDQPTSRSTLRASLSLSTKSGGSAETRRFLVTAMAGQGGAPLLADPSPTPATCSDAFVQDGRSASVWVSGDSAPMRGCAASCLVTAPRAQLCSNAKQVVEVDPSFTFWMYLIVRVFVSVISGTSFAMFEGAVIAILREHSADYGLQRIYAHIGGMISSPLSGVLIDYASAGKGYTDFRPAFYLYAALKLASGFLMLTINLTFKTPAANVVSDVLLVLKNVEMVSLFIVCFLLGTAWGYIENFLFWLLQDLGASRSLMGVTVTVGGIAGLPLLVMSGPIIAKIGHANVLFIGFVFYAIRLFGYSMIYNPWLCLVFEAMESFTTSLATTAAVTYGAALSTMSTDTSVQGLIGGLYYGVGKGAGSLLGGFLMTAVGTRNTYRVFAAGSLVAGSVYFLFNRFYLRHVPAKKQEKEAKAPSDKDKEACPMSDITKEKEPIDDVNNKTAADAVQIKNNKNGQLQLPLQQAAAPHQVESAPLKAAVGGVRDYSSSADSSAPAPSPSPSPSAAASAGSRRCSANSIAPPVDNLRRRKSSDCGGAGVARSDNVAVNLGFVQDKEDLEQGRGDSHKDKDKGRED